MIRAAVVMVLALGALGCNEGVQGRTGNEALLQVANATYVDQPLPTDGADPAGPVVRITKIFSRIFAGATNRSLAGTVQPGAVSVAVGIEGDRAYWIVPAPGISMEQGAGNELVFDTKVSYSYELSPGQHNLVLRGVLPGGGFGPPTTQVLTVADQAAIPEGTLVVALRWAANADLDLHVVAPYPPDSSKAGESTEVWVKDPSALPPRPVFDPYTDDEIDKGGRLDIDSNGGCVIDGYRAENIFWGIAPPPGHYIARVDAVSMCGEAGTQWEVKRYMDGAEVQEAHGQMTDTDTRFSHTQGSGLTVMEWDI